jgi:hypothetical protein
LNELLGVVVILGEYKSFKIQRNELLTEPKTRIALRASSLRADIEKESSAGLERKGNLAVADDQKEQEVILQISFRFSQE